MLNLKCLTSDSLGKIHLKNQKGFMENKSVFHFKLKNYILASIAIHLLFVSLSAVISHFESLKKPTEKFELTLIEEPLENKKLDLDEDDNKQIVETDSEHANNQIDKNAKYLSEKSNTTEKETRAKTGEKFKNSLKQATQTVQSQKGQKKTAAIPADDLLNPSFDPYAALMKKQQAQEEKQFAKAQTGTTTGEQSTTNDNLNAKDDLITRLNTKEYKYYGYYHRIKIQLNQWWQPKIREKVTKMMSQGRTIASEENKTTRLIIVLNPAGTLVKVQVLAESGVRDLDEAAIEAFRSAAPFPNPPKGIVDSDGTIKIRWDFVIES